MNVIATMEIGQLLMTLSVIGTGFMGVKKIHSIVKPILDIVEEIVGKKSHHGIPSRPGLIERVGKIESELSEIKSVLYKYVEKVSNDGNN